jgi:hypothetical protein
VATGVDKITGHAGREPAKVDTRMTVTQLDTLQHLTCRLNAAALAVRALGTDADHRAVDELITDVASDLSAFGREVAR